MHQLANNIVGYLTTAINSGATSMNVTLLSGSADFPDGVTSDSPIYLTISSATNRLINEIVKVTEVASGNDLTIVRAQRDTLAQTWAANSRVSLNVCAEDVNCLYPAAFLEVDAIPSGGEVTVPAKTPFVVLSYTMDGGTLTVKLPDCDACADDVLVLVSDVEESSNPTQLDIYLGSINGTESDVSNGSYFYLCIMPGEWVNFGNRFAYRDTTIYTGDRETLGSWRIREDGYDLVFEQLIEGETSGTVVWEERDRKTGGTEPEA